MLANALEAVSGSHHAKDAGLSCNMSLGHWTVPQVLSSTPDVQCEPVAENFTGPWPRYTHWWNSALKDFLGSMPTGGGEDCVDVACSPGSCLATCLHCGGHRVSSKPPLL